MLLRLRQGALRLLRLNATPHGVALGFTLGLGLSLFPIPFVGMVVALALAPLVGASLPAVYAGTAVVNPLTGAAIYFGEMWIGGLLTQTELPSWSEARAYDWRQWWQLSVELLPAFVLGALATMIGASAIAYPTLYTLVARTQARLARRHEAATNHSDEGRDPSDARGVETPGGP